MYAPFPFRAFYYWKAAFNRNAQNPPWLSWAVLIAPLWKKGCFSQAGRDRFLPVIWIMFPAIKKTRINLYKLWKVYIFESVTASAVTPEDHARTSRLRLIGRGVGSSCQNPLPLVKLQRTWMLKKRQMRRVHFFWMSPKPSRWPWKGRFQIWSSTYM